MNRSEVAHGTIFDYDGFAADVEDVPSNWNPTFSHVVDPWILVCVPKSLRLARQATGITLSDAARILGISVVALSELERGRTGSRE